ncbi:MAG: hypothetical protein GTO55_04155 [Armatimonadetes bacterium]|nr:hypothetical protein [Armatimonadota bacterium]NIM23464.1 hypothetical protein [Armatimonadota bacterium]NIM67330.1 hypothetical protein [Armatimonadota bacterium]NIM75827.1 hypothetical protein [Armatimonadota bacterium]NIN05515.1 hypothetical protein [Armatimonadota bacterium]
MRCRAFSVLLTGILFMTMFGMAWSAVPDPPGCFGIDVDSSLSPDKGTPYHINETVFYTVEFMNNPNPPGTNCDMENVIVEFFPPGADGQPSAVAVVLDSGISFPADGTTLNYNSGTDPELAFSLAGLNPDVQFVIARATLTGNLQDATGLEQSVSTQVGIVLLQPCIQITKTPDVEVTKCGDTVNYEICITNCSDAETELQNMTVNDTLLGDISLNFPVIPAPGETVCATIPYVVGSGPDECETAEILSNTVTVYAEDATGADACDPAIAPNSICEATAEVKLIQPSISIEKTCEPDPVGIGETLTWTITVCNTSPAHNAPVTLDIHVVDPTAGIDQVETAVAPGECRVITATHVVEPGDAPEISDTASAQATITDEILPNIIPPDPITAQDTCIVAVEPCIECEKSADTEVSKEGDTITYTLWVRNCGEVTLVEVVMNDDLLGPMPVPPVLAPGEEWSTQVPYEVQPGDPDPLVNIMTVSGMSEATGEPVTNESPCSVSVDLVEPEFTIEKICELTGDPPNQLLTWTITICNTGDISLDVHVVDPELGIDQIVTLAPGECQDIVAERQLTEEDCDIPITNTTQAYATITDDVLPNRIPPEGFEEASSTCEMECPSNVTRTPGYWFTHPVQLLAAFECLTDNLDNSNGSTIVLCDGCEVNAYDAMAIFWRTSGGNRPTLAQHILAAMFNECMFGSSAGSAIEDGLAVLCNPDATSEEIGYAIMPLDEFNNSGTEEPFPDGFVNTNANPRESRNMASDGTVPDCAAGTKVK